jgi:hypothetical protein
MPGRKLDTLGRTQAPTLSARGADPMSGAQSSAAVRPAIAEQERASSLPALKALISNHRTLLANVRRSNQLLENENTRMERELAVRRESIPPAGPRDEDASIANRNANAKLVWIENYIHGTLAQTLWALNARAVQLEEQLTSTDQQHQTHRLLEMTHQAYDQLRGLMARLQGDTFD